jgi:hypothetical protein
MNARAARDSAMTTELLLEVFDLPVAFHRCLVPITGGVTSALLLSHAIWTSQTMACAADGWFSKSRDQWTDETGLSRWEQETARRALRSEGFLEERRVGVPAKLWFRVCPEVVWRALQAHAAHASR